VIPQRRQTLQIGALQRPRQLRIVIGHESAVVLAPGALSKRDPILPRQLRKLRVEPPAVIEPQGWVRIKGYLGKLPAPRNFEEGADILR
jgi:hypothetical protein